MLRRSGLRDLPARLTETTDAPIRKNRFVLCAPLLARIAGMVRRRRVRTLFACKRQAGRGTPHADRRRILRRASESPLFASQPLLLRRLPGWLATRLVIRLESRILARPPIFSLRRHRWLSTRINSMSFLAERWS